MPKRPRRNRGKLSRRRYIKNAPGPSYTHIRSTDIATENLNRIQSSNLYFADIEVKKLDPWRTSTSNRLPHKSQTLETCGFSLVDKCAQAVAQHIIDVPLEYLDSWNIWKHVWKHVLVMSKDSPEIFAAFCKKFNSEPDFRCHQPNQYNNLLIKGLKISHRLENLHSDTNLTEIAKYSREYPSFLYALTITSNARSLTNPMQLANINLTSLNISYLALDNSFIRKMVTTIEMEGKLPNLQILIMHHCKNVSESLVLLILENPRLPFQYMETDFMLLDSEFAQKMSVIDISSHVKGTNWKYLSSETVLPTLPLGLKMYALANKFDFNYFNGVIVDLFMYPSSMTGENSWESRRKERHRVNSAYSYIKDLSYIPLTSKKRSLAKTTPSEPIKKSQIRKISNSKKINSLNDFFGM